MLKITIQLSVVCAIFWYTHANCISFFDNTHTVLKGQRVIRCASVHQKRLANELLDLKKEFQYGLPVNLYLYRIVFDKSKIDDEMPKMTNGWFKMTRFTMKWLQLLQIQIFKIENEAFSRPVFKTLEFLEIFDVPLRFLKSGTFNGLDKLKVLSMRGLRLDRIEKNVLATMPSLEGLSLNQCGSKIIHLDNLFGENILRVLRHINVHNCILGDTITDQTFSSIPSIESLSLNSDSIDIIAPNSLDYLLRRVKRLSLGWNKLKSVPIDLFQIDREVTIELTGNPWHCDCQLENLRIFERTTTSVKFNGLICATPEKYRGIPLRNCPFLCNEIVLPYTETDKPIQTQLITVKPEPGSQNVIQVAVNVHEKISFMCQSSTSPQKSITLTKSSHKIGAMTQIEGGQLHIDAAFLKNDFKLIEFNHFQSNEFDEIVFNNEKSCATYKRNEPHNIQIQRKLEPHVLYRFCWTEKGSVTIVPLDCNTFHLNEGDATLKDVDAWIMKSEKPIVITVCTLSAILALVIGILIAIALAKLFPTKIRGRMTDFGKSVTKNFDQIRSSKEQETFNRLRQSDQSVCQSVDTIKFQRPMIQMLFDTESYTKGMETPDYETIEDIPPPLPPRTKYATVQMTIKDDNFKCCNSENCECYCEL